MAGFSVERASFFWSTSASSNWPFSSLKSPRSVSKSVDQMKNRVLGVLTQPFSREGLHRLEMTWWILSYDSKGLGQFSGLVAALRIQRTIAQIRYDNERKCSTRSKKLGLVSRCGLAAVYTEKPTTRSGHVARDNQACPATLLLVACLTWHILSSQRRTRPPIVRVG